MSGVGSWSFIIGLIIAVIVGLFTEATGMIVTILVLLGLVVGFLNITDKEIHGFLVAAIALMLAGGAGNLLGTVPAIGGILERVLNNFVVFVAPSAIVVAVKQLYNISKD